MAVKKVKQKRKKVKMKSVKRIKKKNAKTVKHVKKANMSVKKQGNVKKENVFFSGRRFQEFIPVIDKKACIKCRACFAFCPDSAIAIGKDGIPKIDYDKCKGCLICLRECPVRAISEERAK